MVYLKEKIAVILILLLASCVKQRDLFDTVSPLLQIQGDWVPSLGAADMSGRATVMLFKGDEVDKRFFNLPNSVTAKTSRGEYNILLFNGMMFSEEITNLDHIFFRNTAKAETFEAVVVEVISNSRLARAQGEYIAGNDMEILTSAHTQLFVEGETQFNLKYKDGRNGYPVVQDYVESTIKLTPRALSYPTQVIVHLVYPRSAAIANGSLRGFAGSVFLASGAPSTFEVTHQVRLNSLVITHPGTNGDANDPELGTIVSPIFNTFGPPLDQPNRLYTFEINVILVNGEVVIKTFDVTDQIKQTIEKIHLFHQNPIGTLTIPIEIFLELTDVIGSAVSVNDWGDDEIIRVVI
ncbi:MAG: hypothetical protein LBC84_00245 [Prevotellaceae bacterium]|jgi:hypothetical protein|nr:hypothetical protein [Prevotellaceae bacterium]